MTDRGNGPIDGTVGPLPFELSIEVAFPVLIASGFESCKVEDLK